MNDTTHAVTHVAKARMWPQKHRSGNVTWKVQVGKKNNGQPDIRSFPTEKEARVFYDDWNAKLVTGNTNGLADLSTLARAEVLAALAKLDAFNATLTEAVDFFLKHARPARGTITVEDALKTFLEAKQALKRSPAYLRGCKKTYYLPFTREFPGKMLADISQADAEKYINSHKNWSSSSKASHINYLRTFYAFFIKKGYAKLNPFANIEKPQAVSSKPKVITPEKAQELLQFVLDNGRKAECAAMALVFFCGVRVEGEAGEITWEDIDLERSKVKVSTEVSKTGHRRVNDIPANALEWLKLCQSTGRVAPNDYLQRMKRLRAKSGVEYRQNAMRHCFASYYVAHFKDAAKLAVILGHPNPALLYRTYYELVTPEDAAKYWDILPASVRATREAEARAQEKAKDDEAREFAELGSNCGHAIKQDGQWISVQKTQD